MLESQGDEKAPALTTQTEPENAGNHLRGWPLALLMTGLCFVLLLIALDLSVLATAIPTITNEFHTVADIAWYASSYIITQCTFVPLADRTYTYFPLKTTYICFVALFEFGSLVCGTAQSSGMLIAGRTVSGMGSSGIMNGTMTIVAIVTPAGHKAIAMGLLVSLFGLGQVIGPLVSGGLTQHASWRWCFYINLPIGAIVVLCFLFVKLPAYGRKPWTLKTLFWDLDIPGFAILAPACVLLLIALQWGGNEYAWKSATIIGMLCGSAAVFAIFATWEARARDKAMIPLHIVKLRPVASAMTVACLMGGATIILTYYLPLYFQVVKNMTPAMSGVDMLPTFLAQVLSAAVTGYVVQKISLALPSMVLGSALSAVSYGLLSTLEPRTGKAAWIGYQIIAGFGRGMALQMPTLVVQGAVAKADIATGTSTIIWSQFMGMAVLISGAQAIFINLLKSKMKELVPQLKPEDAVNAGATAYIASVPQGLRSFVVQAYNDAITGTNYLGVGLAAISVVASIGVWNMRVEAKATSKPGGPISEDTGKAPSRA